MKKKYLVLILIILIPLVFTGCPDQKEDKNQKQSEKPQAEEQKKNPEKLKKLQDDIEAMISMLSGIPVIELKKQEQEQGKEQQSQGGQGQGGQSEDSEQGGGQQSQQGGQSSQQGQGSGQQSSQQNKSQIKSLLQKEMPVNWEQAMKDVQKIHIEWNDYVSEAAKNGVSKSNIDNFENTLNKFTNLILNKKKDEASIYANSLLFSLINFWSYYKLDYPIDVLRLKCLIRNVILYSAVSKWDKVMENFNLSKALIQTLRAASEKEQQEKVNKVDFAIMDLEKAVKINDYPLIRLKGKLVIDNLSDMEKKKEE